jgi:hypothetical protein
MYAKIYHCHTIIKGSKHDESKSAHDVQLVKIQLTQSSLLFSTPLLPCLCALSAAFLGWQCGTTFWRKFSSALLWQHSIVVVGLSWHNSVRS